MYLFFLSTGALFEYKMSLKGRSCWAVNICMDGAAKLSLEAIGRLVDASEEIRFETANRQQLYGWVERVLAGQRYGERGKAARGLVRRYIVKMTGLSRAQVTRRILERELLQYKQPEYARVAGISVAHLYNLPIEQTKSRPRQSGDNGLVETKNGTVICKHIG